MAKHEQQAYERLGAKVLTLPDVIAQSVGFMGPVFSSAFVIPLVVGVISASGKGGGVASPLSVLIAAVGVFAIGAIVSRRSESCLAAIAASGWSGLPQQFSAASRRFRVLISVNQRERAPGSRSISGMSQWLVGA